MPTAASMFLIKFQNLNLFRKRKLALVKGRVQLVGPVLATLARRSYGFSLGHSRVVSVADLRPTVWFTLV